MPNLGQWLVAKDNLHASEMIVVLMESVPDRIIQVVDIYNTRYSDKIVLVNSYRIDYYLFSGIGKLENRRIKKHPIKFHLV